MESKKKSAIAKKNSGNDLFFRILKNILTDKNSNLFNEHLEDSTFEDVYTFVGVEKALQKCYDYSVVKKMIESQPKYCNALTKKSHYWLLMNILPKTYKFIDWKNGI